MAIVSRPHQTLTIRDPLNILTPFDQQTAQTGGIQRISAARTPRGRYEISVEGILLPPLDRKSAPNFNSSLLKKRDANDLRVRLPIIDLYQMAHLWGPGFGDETPAGMMWAPTEINLEIQARIERFLRDYAEQAAHEGTSVRLKATAIAWDWKDNFADFLHIAEYEVGKLRGGAGYDAFTASVEAPMPGVPGKGKFNVERVY